MEKEKIERRLDTMSEQNKNNNEKEKINVRNLIILIAIVSLLGVVSAIILPKII